MPSIPQIGPQSGPDFVPQEGGARPSPVGRALADFGGAFADIGKVFQAQQANDDQLRLAQQSLTVQDAAFAARLAAKQAPPTAQLQTFDASYQQAIKDSGILEDPNNARIADQLKMVAARHFQDVRQEVMVGQLTATARDQEAGVKNIGPQYAQRAAADYTAGPSGVVDGPVAIESREQYRKLIDGMAGIGPQAKASMISNFDHDVTFMRGQVLANSDHPETAFDYIAANPQFTEAEKTKLRNEAISAIQRPAKQIDAALTAERGTNDIQVMTSFAQGKPLPDVDAMMARRALSETVYQHVTGHPYVANYPDEAGQADIYGKMVAEQGAEDGPQVRRIIADAHQNRVLSKETSGQLILNSWDREKKLKDPIIYGKHAAKSVLLDTFFAPRNGFKLPFDTEVNRGNFEARWQMEEDAIKSPADIPKAVEHMKEWYADQTKGGAGRFGKLLGH